MEIYCVMLYIILQALPNLMFIVEDIDLMWLAWTAYIWISVQDHKYIVNKLYSISITVVPL